MRPFTIAFLILLFISLPIATAQSPLTPAEHCETAQPGELSMMRFDQPQQVLQAGVDYRAIFCSGAGAIYIDLYETLTPVTVNNFIFLAGQGYYDSTTFHRVIPDFMAQGGDPTATGRGGPGYQFQDEPIGFLTFDQPGKLAMANAGPGTNGSQFFITTAPTPHLNYKHTIFGDVLQGQEHVGAIRPRDPQSDSQPGESLHTVLIISDPTLVASDEVTQPSATVDEVTAAFDAFTAGLPSALQLDAERSGHFSADDLAATVADDLAAGFADFAEGHGHQYRVRMQVLNATCADSVFFSSLGYWVDAFADAESAREAASDPFMAGWLASYDYAPDPDSAGMYRREAGSCSGDAGVHLLALYPRGRFLATLDLLVAESLLNQASAADITQYMNLQLEAGLAAVFKGATRA